MEKIDEMSNVSNVKVLPIPIANEVQPQRTQRTQRSRADDEEKASGSRMHGDDIVRGLREHTGAIKQFFV